MAKKAFFAVSGGEKPLPLWVMQRFKTHKKATNDIDGARMQRDKKPKK